LYINETIAHLQFTLLIEHFILIVIKNLKSDLVLLKFMCLIDYIFMF